MGSLPLFGQGNLPLFGREDPPVMAGRTATGTAPRSFTAALPPAHSHGLFPWHRHPVTGRSPGPRRDVKVARRSRTPRRGRRGLIGMLLSIVVAVVIVIAIFSVYNQLTAAANAAQTALFVRQLAPQITSQYRGDYTGLDNAAAISSGFVPDNWRNGDTITDPSGARVTIRAGGSTVERFVVIFVGGIPVGSCKAVLGALKSDPTFFSAMSSGGNHVRSTIDTPATITAACAGSASGDFRVRFH